MASADASSPVIEVDKVGLNKHYLSLTESQCLFVRRVVRWIMNPRKTFVLVSGGPGTGKSYVVKNTFDFVKVPQLRMSFTGRSAQSIGGRTIHSTLNLNRVIVEKLERELENETDLAQSVSKSREILHEFSCNVEPLVVIVDEVSMINGWLMYWIIRYFMDRNDLPLFFVCMGDPHQLNPIKSIHNLFSLTLSEKKYDIYKIHLKESKRYKPEYEKLINRLRDFVDKEDETGMFAFICENFPVVEDIDGNMLLRANKAMAFRNSTVRNYNKFYINKKVSGPEVTLPKDVVLKQGCMVFVTKNNCSTAMNGTRLIFERYSPDEKVAVCKDPNTGSEVRVGRDGYTGQFPLDLGFAGTVHKYQGDTIDDDKIVISLDGSRNLNLVYTALSRVREMNQILAIKL